MKKFTLIFVVFFGLTNCFRIRQIKVIITDADSGKPVSGMQVVITNIERHSSGNSETVVYTNDEGLAIKKYSAPKKDAIRVQIYGKNGYVVVGESKYEYFDYQRTINITVTAKK
jgi:hypothetical protein